MIRRHALLALASLLTLACQKHSQSPTERPLRIAAAADVEPVFTSLAEQYRKKFGREVVLSFAASGALAKQIEHGAPFDLFVSASEAQIERLRSKGRLRPDSIRRYARGQLTIWTAGDGPLPQSLAELASRTSLRIALAHPEHAPYGQAAVAALRQAGVYDAVSRRLVFAENVRQAQQFAESGNTDVAIIARSLAGRSGRFVEIPLSLHPPIVQSLAVVADGDERAASDFTALLFDPPGRLLLRDSGFLPPE
jgi:molybdate transport system substrate-binding protein